MHPPAGSSFQERFLSVQRLTATEERSVYDALAGVKQDFSSGSDCGCSVPLSRSRSLVPSQGPRVRREIRQPMDFIFQWYAQVGMVLLRFLPELFALTAS